MNVTVTSFESSVEGLASAIGPSYGFGIYMSLKGREPLSFLNRQNLTGFRCVIESDHADCYCLSQYGDDIFPLAHKLSNISWDCDEILHIEVFGLDEETFERLWNQLGFWDQLGF